MAAHRASYKPPAAMRQMTRWVRRTTTKVPLRADGKGAASSTNPDTWATYEQAVRSTVGVGVGFVLDADGIVCLDLDHCVDEHGQVAGWAQHILDQCPPTWVEVSASGSGLHVWGRGRVGLARRIRDGMRQVEVYDRGRYIALGRPMPGCRPVLGDLSQVLGSL